MRLSVIVLIAGAALTEALPARAPPASEPIDATQRIGTMSELMIHLIYPTSDAIFYITTRTPTNTAEWTELEGKTLVLAEAANLLMMPIRARDNDQWISDATLMLEAGAAALRAAKDQDVEALSALNDQLYQSCVTCHEHYRPG